MAAFRHVLSWVSSIAGVVLVSTSPLLAAPPSVPANFHAASPTFGTVEVTWNDTRNETSYQLDWGPNAITMSVFLAPNDTSQTFTALSTFTTYLFRVRACNAEGCGPFTIVSSQTPSGSNGLPAQPADFVVTSPVTGTVVLTWAEGSNETTYEIGWGAGAITFTITLNANSWQTILNGLSPSVTYLFRIRACNFAGCGPFTSIVGQAADGTDGCVLTQNVWYSNGFATISYVGGTALSTTWRVWLIGHFGASQILSLPAGFPLATGDLTFPLSPLGNAGFLTAFSTPDRGLLCTDFDTVDTFAFAGSASSIKEAIEQVKAQLIEELNSQ